MQEKLQNCSICKCKISYGIAGFAKISGAIRQIGRSLTIKAKFRVAKENRAKGFCRRLKAKSLKSKVVLSLGLEPVALCL